MTRQQHLRRDISLVYIFLRFKKEIQPRRREDKRLIYIFIWVSSRWYLYGLIRTPLSPRHCIEVALELFFLELSLPVVIILFPEA